jgi:SSS family solute:Na+ symporter
MPDAFSTTVIVGYAIVLATIGIVSFQRAEQPLSFFLEERSLGPFRFVGTMFSTFFGTGLLFTLASFGYLHGVGALVLPGAAVLGFVFFARAAPFLKRTSGRESAVTLPALFRTQWRLRTRTMAALVTLSLFAGTLSVSFHVVGDVLQAIYNIPRPVGIGSFAALVIAYTSIGGFRGVVRTDILQMFVILGTVLFLPFILVLQAGTSLIESVPPSHLNPLTLPMQLLIVYLLIGVFAFFGSQDLYQRVYAARDGQTARRGIHYFAVLLFIVGVLAVGLGIMSRALVPNVPADRALVSVAAEVIPTRYAGLVVLGFIALANSDADSQLLTITSNLSEDLLPHLDTGFAERDSVLVDRLIVVSIGVIAVLVALVSPSLTALFGSLGSWFAILGFVVIATIYWDRMTDVAAFFGLVVGFITPVVFVMLTGNLQAATIVGLVAAVLIVVVTSLVIGEAGEAGPAEVDNKPTQ